jgi:hypothetical protein
MALHFPKSDKPSELVQKATVSETITKSVTVPDAIPESATNGKPISEPEKPASRKRGVGETVSITFRVPKDPWMRLHQLAMSEGESLQSLIWEACSAYLVSKGQLPL